MLIVVLIDCFHHGDGQMSFEVLPLCQYRCLRTVLRVQSSTGTSSHDSTLEATVLLSTYCTHVAIKYWEYDSTLVDATVYYNTTLCLLYKLSMSQLGVMPNTALNVSFYACPLCPLLLLPFH